MAKSDPQETKALQLFASSAEANDADATWTVHLHTADIGDDGSQADNQAPYTGYAGQPINRDGATDPFCTVTGDQLTNSSPITFPAPTDGLNLTTLTHGSIGNGTTRHYHGALTAQVTPEQDIEIVIPAGGLILTEA